MRAIGYVRVSTDKQADHGVSLEAQSQKIRAMATVQEAELLEAIVDSGELRHKAVWFQMGHRLCRETKHH